MKHLVSLLTFSSFFLFNPVIAQLFDQTESLTFDASLVSFVQPSEYQSIPFNQLSSFTLGGTVANNGLSNLTNAQLWVEIYQDSLMVFADSSQSFNLLVNDTTDVSIGSFMPLAKGDYRLKYFITIAESDGDLSNDTLWTSPTTISDSVFAREDGQFTNSFGIGLGIPAEIGQTFTLMNKAVLHSVSIFLVNGGNKMLGQPVSLKIYNFNGEPDSVIAITDTIIVSQSNSHWLDLPLSSPIILEADTFAFMAQEGDSILTLGANSNFYQPGTGWINFMNNPFGGFATIENYGYQEAYLIRPNLSTFCDLVLDSVHTTMALCYGDPSGTATVSVSNANGPLSYLWPNGGNGPMGIYLSADTHIVFINDLLGCSASASFVIAQPDSLSMIINSIQQTSCLADSNGAFNVSISGGVAPFHFLWNTGDTTEDLTEIPMGNYSAQITDANGCTFLSQNVPVTSLDSMPMAHISSSISGGSVTFDPGSPNGNTFSWDFGDNAGTSNDETPKYTYSANGSYVVTLTVSNDCGTITVMDTVNLETVGITEIPNQSLQVFPNPSHGNFQLVFQDISLSKASLVIHSSRGEKVWETSMSQINSASSYKIVLPKSLSKGVYFLRIRAEEGMISQTILIE